MSFTRRDFLKSGLLATGAIMFTGKEILSKNIFLNGVENIRNNVGFYTENGGTIGWYVDRDAFVIIDTQNPKASKNLLTSLREKTDRKIDVLFNTHHHGDHTAGNIYLKEFTNKIVASEKCVELQKKFYGTGEKASQQVYADVTFSERETFDVGKETIIAHYKNPAHTEGDAIYHFENANVVHVGDLVFNKIFPWIDRSAGNTFRGWIRYLSEIEQLFDNDTKFIFGHGLTVTGTKKDITLKREYFEALSDHVINEMKKGKSKEKIINATGFKGDQGRKEAWQGAAKMSLEAAYIELSK